MEKFKLYYSLTKPRVTYGNVLTVLAGFLFGASYFKTFDLGLFLATLIGMTLIIAAACALNNVLDRDIDALMERTKGRAVAAGQIKPRDGFIFASVVLILSLIILGAFTNLLTFWVGLLGFVIYVWGYGAIGKRRSVHGTLVGSISGAMPILAGYTAVSNQIDPAGILLFLMLFFWQFPEFYSIAIYRKNEYAAAGVPVMTVVKGVTSTKKQIYVYTILFVVSSLMLSVYGFTGWIYFVIMGLLGAYWIWLARVGLKARNSDAWAKKMFHFALIVLLVLCVMLPLGVLLP